MILTARFPMPFSRFTRSFSASSFSRLFLLSAAVVAITSCSSSEDERLSSDLAPPSRVDLLSPPVAPDPSTMHPALQVARSRGLKTNVYFNEELQQAVSRLSGMEETLGRLQNDLQGTALAMQRVEMMRQEIEALNIRFQSLQERLVYAGPVLGPAPAESGLAMTIDPVDAQSTTTVTTTTLTAPAGAPNINDAPSGPTPLMGDMAAPANTPSASAQMKPVIDEKAAVATKAVKPISSSGVSQVRVGAHSDTVRVVLDVNGDAAFTSNLDAAEKLLTIELPKAKWPGAKSESFKNNPLVAGYTAQPSGDGSIVAFPLKGDTKIVKTTTLKNPTRVVIDLAK